MISCFRNVSYYNTSKVSDLQNGNYIDVGHHFPKVDTNLCGPEFISVPHISKFMSVAFVQVMSKKLFARSALGEPGKFSGSYNVKSSYQSIVIIHAPKYPTVP
jgi:hypothetical protein